MSQYDPDRGFTIGCSIVMVIALMIGIWVGLRKVFFYPIQLHLDDVGLYCDTSIFHGIVTEMTFREMCEAAGVPDEFDTYKEDDEVSCNPIYHFENGEITCAWTGDQDDRIGMVEFSADTNSESILIGDLLFIPLDVCSITHKTKQVWLYHEGHLYYKIFVKKMKVLSIEYWNIPKKQYTKRRGNYWFQNGKLSVPEQKL